MPGLLKRSHDQVDGAADDEAAGLTPDRKRVALEKPEVNGAPGAGGDGPTSNGVRDAAPFPATGIAPDPELRAEAKAVTIAQRDDDDDDDATSDLPHVTAGYVPLGTLVDRLAQETFNELDDLIQELADMQATQVNGYGSAQSVAVNVQKKERIFYYAHNYRTKFIKLLVLSQWSCDAHAVSRLIDLHNWLLTRREEYRNAVSWMGELKRMTTAMKLAAPDLNTTLEVLSTGKATWISDLDYTPQAPLTRGKVTKALRTINTQLRIRLNLHEKIPDEMMDFTIRDGRATFRVKDEFEVELSIADEDPSSQLYFIDFRFAFSPCEPDIGDGPVRSFLNAKADAVLKADGLKGCYDFLHDFVLTHKLSILRNQAIQMARGLWSDGIRVEQVHRGLVVQYWTGRPGHKNWIELGVKRRRRKAEHAHETEDPHISLRWHMHGKEVRDHGVELDVADLSLERTLKSVICKHTNIILKKTKQSLKKGAVYRSGLLSAKHRAHPTEPAESHLKMQLTPDKTVTVTQDPIDGSFYISPKNPAHAQTEYELNRLRTPADDAGMRLALLRCNEVLGSVHRRANMRRWLSVQSYRPNTETLRRLFQAEQVRLAFFRVRGWDASWLLAVTASLDGDRWWVVECQDTPRNPTPMDFVTEAYQPLKRSLLVPLNRNQPTVFEPTPRALGVVERTAAAVVSQFVDARELARIRVQYTQQESRKTTGDVIRSQLCIRLPLPPLPAAAQTDSRDEQPRPQAGRKAAKPWCSDMLHVDFVGVSLRDSLALTIVRGKLARPIPHIERFRSSLDSGLAFHPHNATFAFRLRTRLGQASVPDLRARLEQISTLVSFVDVTARNQLDCTRVALDSLTFSYAALDREPAAASAAASLLATVSFSPGQPLRLQLPPGNPHLRIADSLARVLNARGLNKVVAVMRSTLSLLRGLSALEADRSSPHVRAAAVSRSEAAFVVRYTGQRAAFSYAVGMRYRGADGAAIAFLHGFEARGAAADPGAKSDAARARAAPLKAAWQALCHERHQPWDALGDGASAASGIGARVDVARGCLLHIDGAMRAALVAADALEVPGAAAPHADGAADARVNGAAGAAGGGVGPAVAAAAANTMQAAAAGRFKARPVAGAAAAARGKEIITLD